MGNKPRLLHQMHTAILLQSLSIISVKSQGSHKVDTNINHLKRRKTTQLGISRFGIDRLLRHLQYIGGIIKYVLYVVT
jgi:hypothetical protein